MTDTTSRDWRRICLFAVVIGGMTVSISGQVKAIEAQLGWFLAVVFAVTNDAGAILALDIALSTTVRSIRGWAWVAILLAAGTGGALNSYHAAETPIAVSGEKPLPPPLPTQFAILVGLEPVVLVLVLSHLIGLVITARKSQIASPGDRQPAPDRQPVVAPGDRHETVIVTTGRPQGDRQVPAEPTERPAQIAISKPQPATTSPTATRAARQLAVVPAPRPSWMTAELLDRVIAARREDRNYGRSQVVRDHQLTAAKARALIKYIDEHNLVRASA